MEKTEIVNRLGEIQKRLGELDDLTEYLFKKYKIINMRSVEPSLFNEEIQNMIEEVKDDIEKLGC